MSLLQLCRFLPHPELLILTPNIIHTEYEISILCHRSPIDHKK
uniref:Uncharacterized protein n=1 Tax=Anguilla anguilla TaxID=7936 RepID=A0A0E9QAC1_ANGAN